MSLKICPKARDGISCDMRCTKKSPAHNIPHHEHISCDISNSPLTKALQEFGSMVGLPPINDQCPDCVDFKGQLGIVKFAEESLSKEKAKEAKEKIKKTEKVK